MKKKERDSNVDDRIGTRREGDTNFNGTNSFELIDFNEFGISFC